MPRNTAPAIALGAWQALAQNPTAILLILPADHLIGDAASFAEAVGRAVPLADQGWQVTWSDIGSWDALWAASEHDNDGNRLKGDVIAIDSRNCFVRGTERRLVRLWGSKTS